MIEPIERPSITEAVGGSEETHFNPVCAQLIDRIVGPVLGVDVDNVQREVPCAGRRLDLLATADVRRVAIELQYGDADPGHLGRLVGWYAPHVAATDMILVAESFPTTLKEAVREKGIPNLALIKAITGWNRDGAPALDFEVVASNIASVQGGALRDSQKSADRKNSTQLLGDALDRHGLQDSNASSYVRLFLIRDGFWANTYVRAARVVLHIGAYSPFDAEAAVRLVDDDWGPQGNGMYFTVSDDVDSYVLSEEDAEKVADKISRMQAEIEAALNAGIASATLDQDKGDESDQSLREAYRAPRPSRWGNPLTRGFS